MQIRQIGGAFLHQKGMFRAHFGQSRKDIRHGGQAAGIGIRRMGRLRRQMMWGRCHGADRGGRFGRMHQMEQRLCGEHGVTHQAVAHSGAGGFGRIVGNMQKMQPFRQIAARHPRIIAEHGRTDDNGDIMLLQPFTQRPFGKGKPLGIKRVGFQEGRTLAGGGSIDCCPHLLSEGDGIIPAIAAINRCTKDESWCLGGGEDFCKFH